MPPIKGGFGLKSTASIKPQRFAIHKPIETSTVKENVIQTEINTLEVLENKMSQFKLEKIKKVLSQTKVPPLANKDGLAEDLASGDKLKIDRSEPIFKNKIWDGPKNSEESKKRLDPSNPNNTEEIDYDEGLRKIKTITKKVSNYQICDLIQLKNQRNLKGDNTSEFPASHTLFTQSNSSHNKIGNNLTIIRKSDTESQLNYLVQLRLPEQLINKDFAEQIKSLEQKSSAKGSHADVIKFPFKVSPLEEGIRIFAESQALPKVIEPISKLDMAMRLGKLNAERLGSHECHLCFNLALSFERDGEFEKVNLLGQFVLRQIRDLCQGYSGSLRHRHCPQPPRH